MTHLFPLMCNLASLIITKTRMDNSSRNQVIVTFKDRVLVKIKIEYWIELRAITNCVSEEADPWVVWHVRDMVPQGFSPVILQTKDTNVLVLQISFASNIRNDSNSTICAEMYSTDNEDTYIDPVVPYLSSVPLQAVIKLPVSLVRINANVGIYGNQTTGNQK